MCILRTKKAFLLLCGFLLMTAFYGCSDSDSGKDEPEMDSYVRFLKSEITVSSFEGETRVAVEWSDALWKVTAGTGELIKDISLKEGGEPGKKGMTTIVVKYNENTLLKTREQDVFLTDLTTGEKKQLTIKQESKTIGLTITLDPTQKYQRVVGFGGMYNPVIWTGSNLLTSADIDKLYSPSGLGYNILRLMIYDDAKRWDADVEGAKRAQALGAIIFACPWYPPAALCDKTTVNGKEFNHLSKANYQAYADHLVDYINYMKKAGINLEAISVQNEPDMEFTFWHPSEIVDFVKTYGEQIRNTGVKLMAPETCGFQSEWADPLVKDADAFAVTDIVAGHLYQGYIADNAWETNRRNYITRVYTDHLKPAGKTWWMTEHLFNDGEKETDPTLWQFQKWTYNMSHLAKEVHMCMEGYCSAYVYWYLKRFYGMLGDTDNRCQVKESEIMKNGYILGHYAKYATGMDRIRVQTSNSDVSATGYINETETEMTVVLLNMNEKSIFMEVTTPYTVETATAVETTGIKNMTDVQVQISEGKKGGFIQLSPQSLVSVRLKLQK